ncbi:MAG: ATP-binding cassette domain-containing protein [Planctomycetes bacterium]|nr:ATP-binding cassette domain-containing protein [Planctomycetota bacterium]
MELPEATLTPRQTDDIVRALAVTTEFDGRTVLDGVDLAIRRGEVFVIMGPSGCGKTTLLRHLCGLQPPSFGMVTVEGHDIHAASPELLQLLRLRTGLSFQGGALLGSMSVLENVALPLRENTTLSDRVIVETARMKLDMVGLLHAADLLPSSLSGGMRKRAAIARAIALDPEIVYFDEPSAGLDPITAAEVDNLIQKLNQMFGITMVVVTHDLQSAHTIADRIAVLHAGEVLRCGTRDQIWGDPDPRIRGFIERRLPAEESRGMDILGLLEVET